MEGGGGWGWERDGRDAAGSADSCLVGFNGRAPHTTYGPQISLSARLKKQRRAAVED